MHDAYLELLCEGLPEAFDGALALGEEHLGEVLAPLGQLGAPSQQRYTRVLVVLCLLGFFFLFLLHAVRSSFLPSLYRRWSVVCVRVCQSTCEEGRAMIVFCSVHPPGLGRVGGEGRLEKKPSQVSLRVQV